MDVEKKRALSFCAAKTVLIEAQFNATLNVFSGVTALNERLDNISGMRIKCFNSSLLSGDQTSTLSSVLLLRSTRLAANLPPQSFRLALSTDATTQTAQCDGGVIGWMLRSAASSSNGASLIESNHSNNILPFASPHTSIDWFDWTVEPLTGSFTSPATKPFSIFIALEFMKVCECQAPIYNVYST